MHRYINLRKKIAKNSYKKHEIDLHRKIPRILNAELMKVQFKYIIIWPRSFKSIVPFYNVIDII